MSEFIFTENCFGPNSVSIEYVSGQNNFPNKYCFNQKVSDTLNSEQINVFRLINFQQNIFPNK